MTETPEPTETPPEPERRYGWRQMVESIGITYRQLDYWTRARHLHGVGPARGPGYTRTWSERDWLVASTMKRLIDAGLHPVSAAQYAVDTVDQGVTSMTTMNGVNLSWRSERPPDPDALPAPFIPAPRAVEETP